MDLSRILAFIKNFKYIILVVLVVTMAAYWFFPEKAKEIFIGAIGLFILIVVFIQLWARFSFMRLQKERSELKEKSEIRNLQLGVHRE